MIKTRTLLKGALVAGALMMLPSMASAAMTGQCSVCHTMHDSQGGVSVTGLAQPNPQLLIGDGCAGCHDVDANAATGRGSFNAPQVGSATSASQDAGGYFSGTAANEHDVFDLGAALDTTFASPTTPPGGTDLGSQLTCAGTTGCHTSGGHHSNTGNDSTTWLDGVGGAGNSYRFLNGVQGIEDDDFENETGTDHNTYYGEARAQGADTTAGLDTISELCAGCHADFHTAVGTATGAGWIRHPTDFAFDATYGATYSAYNATIPVATDDATGATTDPAGTGAIVICLSCHRAHGSDQADLLRFDYTAVQAGDATASLGCETCHGVK
jgi:predicted CXXCH cytochrome family protein